MTENTNYISWAPTKDNIGRIMLDTNSEEDYAELKKLINWYFDSKEYRKKSNAETSAFEWLDVIKYKPLIEWPPVPSEFMIYSHKGHFAINVGGVRFGYNAKEKKWIWEDII